MNSTFELLQKFCDNYNTGILLRNFFKIDLLLKLNYSRDLNFNTDYDNKYVDIVIYTIYPNIVICKKESYSKNCNIYNFTEEGIKLYKEVLQEYFNNLIVNIN